MALYSKLILAPEPHFERSLTLRREGGSNDVIDDPEYARELRAQMGTGAWADAVARNRAKRKGGGRFRGSGSLEIGQCSLAHCD